LAILEFLEDRRKRHAGNENKSLADEALMAFELGLFEYPGMESMNL
jgi:hypothetical protein